MTGTPPALPPDLTKPVQFTYDDLFQTFRLARGSRIGSAIAALRLYVGGEVQVADVETKSTLWKGKA
jgi:hypothetical protein